MPELPEVETTCRGLSNALLGAKIARVEQNRADLRLPMPRNPSERLKGRSLHDYMQSDSTLKSTGSRQKNLGQAVRFWLDRRYSGSLTRTGILSIVS